MHLILKSLNLLAAGTDGGSCAGAFVVVVILVILAGAFGRRLR